MSADQTKGLRARAERQIALAEAEGARATPSPDYRTVFITYRDGRKEKVRMDTPDRKTLH